MSFDDFFEDDIKQELEADVKFEPNDEIDIVAQIDPNDFENADIDDIYGDENDDDFYKEGIR